MSLTDFPAVAVGCTHSNKEEKPFSLFFFFFSLILRNNLQPPKITPRDRRDLQSSDPSGFAIVQSFVGYTFFCHDTIKTALGNLPIAEYCSIFQNKEIIQSLWQLLGDGGDN